MIGYAGNKRTGPAAIVALGTGLLLLISGCSTGAGGQAGPEPTDAEADLAAAKALVDQYSQPPTGFPVDEPLAASPAGLKIAMIQCVTPVCGLAAASIGAGAAAMGVEFSAVKVSTSIADQQAGLDAIIASDPDGVILFGIEASAIGSQLEQLTSTGVAVTTVGMAEVAKYGVQTALNSETSQETWGKVLAAYAIQAHGTDTDAVIYNVPELSFPPRVTQAAEEEFATLCPGCNVRVVDVPITSFGTDAPSRVVSDLQANPETSIAIFTVYEAATGLPAALATADISIDTVGLAPSPVNLQDIRDGALGAGIAIDVGVMFWTALDATARTALGEPLTAAEKSGIPPFQILEAADITFDPAGGYHAFPDFKERFLAAWAAGR